MTTAVCFKCGKFKTGAFTPCEYCGAEPRSSHDRAISLASSDHYCDSQRLLRIAAEGQAGNPPPVDVSLVRELLDSMESEVGQRIMNIFGPLGSPSPAIKPEWAPFPEKLLSAVSELKQSGITRWVLIDKETALSFLRAKGYKKPFFADTGGTIAMLLDRYPHYFIGFLRYVWISELTTYSAVASADEMARNTWNLEGRRADLDLKRPSDAAGSSGLSLQQPFFLVLIPDLQTRFAGLLQ